MLNRYFLALAVSVGLLSPAYSAGTISLSLTKQIDNATNLPLANGKLYFFQAGTTTPQIAYQDTALTIPLPGGSIYTLDAYGRIPQFFLADGSIKFRLDNSLGVTQLAADNVLVIGPSSGSGGGSTVDPTTVMQTGHIETFYGTGQMTGFVRANGRTIGSATSGASERANADTQALFQFLWTVDSNLTVSTGRGASAAADWAANKSIALPDARGRVLAGLDDMGNSAAGRLTSTYFGARFGASPTALGAIAGLETSGLATANLPPYTPSGGVTISNGQTVGINGTLFNVVGGGAAGLLSYNNGTPVTPYVVTATGAFTGNAQGGTSAPFATLPPMILVTTYIKL